VAGATAQLTGTANAPGNLCVEIFDIRQPRRAGCLQHQRAALVISAAELTSLASSHDIISIGMLADDLRRQRHGARTTFVRVATTPAVTGSL
jgi:hypothetical protein